MSSRHSPSSSWPLSSSSSSPPSTMAGRGGHQRTAVGLDQLDVEPAETALITALEQQQQQHQQKRSAQRDRRRSVGLLDKSLPPLGRRKSQDDDNEDLDDHDNDDYAPTSRSHYHLRDVAQRVRLLQHASSLRQQLQSGADPASTQTRSLSNAPSSSGGRQHHKQISRAQDVLESIKDLGSDGNEWFRAEDANIVTAKIPTTLTTPSTTLTTMQANSRRNLPHHGGHKLRQTLLHRQAAAPMHRAEQILVGPVETVLSESDSDDDDDDDVDDSVQQHPSNLIVPPQQQEQQQQDLWAALTQKRRSSWDGNRDMERARLLSLASSSVSMSANITKDHRSKGPASAAKNHPLLLYGTNAHDATGTRTATPSGTDEDVEQAVAAATATTATPLLMGDDVGNHNNTTNNDPQPGYVPMLPQAVQAMRSRHQYGPLMKSCGAVGLFGCWSCCCCGGGHANKQNRRSSIRRKDFVAFHICDTIHFLQQAIASSWMITISIPATIVQLFLFYQAGDPTLDFLPSEYNENAQDPASHISWWFNFVARQAVTLDLARMSEWIILDGMVWIAQMRRRRRRRRQGGASMSSSTRHGSNKKNHMLGPLVTLWCIQSQGWPLIMSLWSILDLCLMHGDNDFQNHWLYWTGWRCFATSVETNSDSILNRSGYLHLLICVLLAGCATAMKRTILAIYFGKRQLADFKPRMEKLLSDVVLLSEVGALADEAENLLLQAEAEAAEETEASGEAAMKYQDHPETSRDMAANDTESDVSSSRELVAETSDAGTTTAPSASRRAVDSSTHEDGDRPRVAAAAMATMAASALLQSTPRTMKGLAGADWHSIRFADSNEGYDEMEQPDVPTPAAGKDLALELDNRRTAKDGATHQETQGRTKLAGVDAAMHDVAAAVSAAMPISKMPAETKSGHQHGRSLSRTLSGDVRLKDSLDRWEEPVFKTDKLSQSSIHDVLKFRRALTYLEESHPFGEAFGPAENRNQCIESAHRVFHRLLRLTHGCEDGLDFEILALITVGDNTRDDDRKRKALRALFRPGARDDIPMLAFVQTCDTVYKRLRFFRASVNNSSVIDKVLEDMFNVFFYFCLSLLILSLMQFNPWPILVSITSLLVSVSFALGPSLSRYVEGLLLIAVRRPFDLGDRIIITGSESIPNPGTSSSWFVEDINLFTTTLRFARTNEVSTVNNYSISSSRIVNCNRSPSATVYFELFTNIAIVAVENKFEEFRHALEQYVLDHPRIWDSLAFCRIEWIDADLQKVLMSISFRHRNTWQDAGRILLNRADLFWYVYAKGKELGIHFETPPFKRLLYHGGVLNESHTEAYKKDILSPQYLRHDIGFDPERDFSRYGRTRLSTSDTDVLMGPPPSRAGE